MGDSILPNHATSLQSFARQFSAPYGKSIVEFGSNHLNDFRISVFAEAYERINGSGLASKKKDLTEMNIAILNRLNLRMERVIGARQIEVQCMMNGVPQIMILKEVKEQKSSIEVSLKGAESETILLENISNFKQLYQRLDAELTAENDCDEEWNPCIEYVIQDDSGSDCDDLFSDEEPPYSAHKRNV